MTEGVSTYDVFKFFATGGTLKAKEMVEEGAAVQGLKVLDAFTSSL